MSTPSFLSELTCLSSSSRPAPKAGGVSPCSALTYAFDVKIGTKRDKAFVDLTLSRPALLRQRATKVLGREHTASPEASMPACKAQSHSDTTAMQLLQERVVASSVSAQ